VDPYGRYLLAYIVVVVATNVGRSLKPSWREGLNLAEAVVAGIVVVLAFRRLYRSGFFSRPTVEQFVEDPETVEEQERRLRRNARQRERRAERRELEARAQVELNHAQVAARIVRSEKKPDAEPTAEGPSKWDRLLDDNEEI